MDLTSPQVDSCWAGNPAAVARPAQRPDQRQLPQRLLWAVTHSSDREVTLSAIALIIAEAVRPVGIHYFEGDRVDCFTPPRALYGDHVDLLLRVPQAAVVAACNTARAHEQPITCQVDGVEGAFIVAVPVFLRNQPPDALAFVLLGEPQSLGACLSTVQLVAAHLTLWHVVRHSLDAEVEARTLAAVLELLARLACCADLRDACATAVADVRSYLAAQSVAIGLSHDGAGNCRLQALSGAAHFNKDSEARAVHRVGTG